MRVQSIAVLHQSKEGAASPTLAGAVRLYKRLCLTLQELGVSVVPVYLDEKFQWVDALKKAPVDLIFNAADLGLFYDITLEPHVAAILDWIGRPYTGSSCNAGLATGDKYLSKLLLREMRIPAPKCFLVSQLQQESVTYPLILKSRYGHNSEGITEKSVVYEKAQLAAVLDEARAARCELVAEEYVDGRELSAGFIGNKQRVVLPFFAIEYGSAFTGRPKILTFNAKWDTSCEDYQQSKPVRFDPSSELSEQLSRHVMAIAETFKINDYGRFDFRIRRDARGNEEACVIDINTNPDINADAGLSRMAAATGLTYPQFIRELINAAMERYEGRSEPSHLRFRPTGGSVSPRSGRSISSPRGQR